MDISISIQLLNSVSLTLFAIAPAIFIFRVTLLGTAIEKAQQEEKAARENDKANLQKEIDEIEKSLPKIRLDGDATALTEKLEELKGRQKNSDKKIKEIKIKYNRINLHNSVLYPCAALLLAVVVGSFVSPLSTQPLLAYILTLSQIVLVIYGILKICMGLLLVQEISANKKESETYTKIKETIKVALNEHEQGKKEEVNVEFIDKAFPLNTTLSSELNLRLRIKLTKGSVLNNVYVWFFVSDGFELLEPKESDAWKQAPDYDPPNIRTVKIKIGTLSVGPYAPGKLKLKTPANPGKYLLRYKVSADGYSSSAKDLWVHVG